MKFVKVFALSLFFLNPLSAQDDFIDPGDPGSLPKTNGLFDDELEPLNQDELIRPQFTPTKPEIQISEPRTQPEAQQKQELSFPEPKKINSSGSKSSIAHGKPLPSLPEGLDLKNKTERVRMDFVQVEIEDVVKYFAERFRRKFIYDPTTLSGKITIISPAEVSVQEAYGAFLSAMEVRGYVVYPAGPYFKIEKAANARKVPVPVVEGSTPNDDSYVTRILTLKYLSVKDISQAVRNLLSRTGGDLIEHAPTNTLIISDYAYNIRRIIRILDILDVESFQEQVEIIALKNAAAPDIARKIQDFFPSGAVGGAAGVAGGGTSPSGRPSRRGDGDAGVIQKVVADERTNSVIVLGSERGIEQVKKFVARIDVPTEGGGGQIHVYPIQNVKAEEIAQTLSSLTSGGKKDRLPTSGLTNAGGSTSNLPSGDVVATIGDVKITADKATNSLVIQSSPRDFEVLKTIIRKLDIRRRQVFIEGAILEASVSKVADWGVSASGPFGRTDTLAGTGKDGKPVQSGGVGTLNGLGFDSVLQSALTNPAALTGVALGFRSGGTFPVPYTDEKGAPQTFNVPLLSAIIRLAATNQDLNVLSTPHILATANEEATLSIGQEIPQQGGTETTSGGNRQTNVIRLKVATEINITPQINQGDYLTLKIKEKINDIGEINKNTGEVTTNNREATTTVIIKDQQTVVIGGLMRDRKVTSISKVPLLGDIPILGWLFKSKSSNSQKVNLLLFLTPYIIKNTGDMNDQFFRKLKEREGFLKELGVEEKKGVPSSGLTPEQIEMLDKDYVKSLNRKFEYPRSPNIVPEVKTPDSNIKTVEPIVEKVRPEPAMPEPIAPEPTVQIPTPAPSPAPVVKPEVSEPKPVEIPTVNSPTAPAPVLAPEPSLPLPVPELILPNPAPAKELSPTKDLILEDSPPEKPRR